MNISTTTNKIIVRHLGLRNYESVWREMQQFTEQRSAETADELWLVEHPPVFTLGLNGKQEHILDAGDIPLIQCDRGGQVTYHGPGQIIIYLMLDLQRRELGVKALVTTLEMAVIELLCHYGVNAEQREGAPGVYINNAKIAALGLRVKRGCCYHGLSFNFDMDLEPFTRINPCGYPGLLATQFRTFNHVVKRTEIETGLIQAIKKQLGI